MMAITRLAVKCVILLASIFTLVQIPVLLLAQTQKAKMLAFEVRPSEAQFHDILVADVSHLKTVNLTRNPISDDIDPSWSLDNRLAYISYIVDHTDVIVFDMSVMASTPVSYPVQVSMQDSSSWSPDGELAFIGYDAQGSFTTVYVVDGTDTPPIDVSPQTRFDDHSVVWRANREIVL